MTDPLLNSTLGKYQIQQRLGDGGMGSVYLAHNPDLQRDVAIKVMHPQYARKSEFRERFQQEARAMAKLNHSGIVQVYDSEASGDWLYIVMEFIRGGNLQEMLHELREADQWINLAEALPLVKKIALALEYAHGNSILHRDIKPANIMMRQTTGDELLPVVTDLGLAKLGASAGITETGASMGTPAYMSPEQGRGDPVDQRSDIYSLGILLFELVSGRRPFNASTWSKAVEQHNKELPPPLESLRPDTPPDVAAIVMKALQKEPDQRFASAAAMAAAIDRLSTDDLLRTVPPTAIAGASSLQTQHQDSLLRPRFQSVLDEFPSLVSSDTVLQVLDPDGRIETFVVNQTSFVIGRGSSTDLVLPDQKASREHVRVQTDGKTFRVTDLESANGTYIGSSRLLANVPEDWDPDQALRIGLHYLRLVPAQSQSAIMTQAQTIGATGNASQGANLFIPQDRLTVQPGQSVALPIVLVNKSDQVNHFEVSVDGLPTEWATLPEAINLMPNGNQEITISFQPPQRTDSYAQEYPVTIYATSLNNPEERTSAECTLTVEPYGQIQSQLHPEEGRSGQPMRVELNNESNLQQTVRLTWSDRGELLDFEPERGTAIQLQPGASETVHFIPTVRKRPWIGGQKNHSIAVRVTQSGRQGSQNLNGVVHSRGLVPGWVPPLLLGSLAVIVAGLVYGLGQFPQPETVLSTLTPLVQEAIAPDTSLAILAAPTPDAQATQAAQQTADAQATAHAVQQTADAQAAAATQQVVNAQATVVVKQTFDAQATIDTERQNADNQATVNAIKQAADTQATVVAVQQLADAQSTAAAAQKIAIAQSTAIAAQQAADNQATSVAVQQLADAQSTAAAAQKTANAQATTVAAEQTADSQATSVAVQQKADAQATAVAAQQTAEAASRLATAISRDATATASASRSEVIQPAPIRDLCPKKIGGDKEFDGHGPVVKASTQLFVKDNNSLWVWLTLRAKETKSDWTEAYGEWEVPLWNAPIGFRITGFTPSTSTANYTDSNHQLDVPSITGGSLVRRFEMLGDTKGDDIGNCTKDDVYMNVFFNEVQVQYVR